MEPHRNIAHNWNKHIEFYVKTYVFYELCGSNRSLVQSSGQFSKRKESNILFSDYPDN